MSNRAIRFFTSDGGIISLLLSMILLLALGGVKLSQVVAARMMHDDAESTCSTWAIALGKTMDIPAMAVGEEPSKEKLRTLQDASRVGDVYRFRIWSKAGSLVFISDRMISQEGPGNLAEHRGQKFLRSVLSGSIITEAHRGVPPQDPDYFSKAYFPILKDGSSVGVLETDIDQTGDMALYQRSFLLTEGIIAMAVFLAGGLPAFLFYRKMMAHRAAQAEALFLAEHDSLTGLPNRKQLEQAGAVALSWNRRNKTHVAALILDLDRFKEVNDSLGHSAGDELLRAFAERLESAVREEDIIARLGGDEFVVLQVGIAQPSGAGSLADRLIKILSAPYDIRGSHVVCAASIGIAIAPADAEELDKLISCADVALYKAKDEGRNTACFFQVGMDATLRDRRRIEADLRRALETGAFQLAYQPQFSFLGGELVGFEALLRWPEGWEPRSPAEFIPIAEESGLIVPIGAWVLKTACKAAAGWSKPLKVAVNLSPAQFRHGDIAAVVQEALDSSGLDPARLELEVTESLWIQNTDVVLDQLERLRKMGISIALDDFGTGYSSLTYLWKFPFDKVKIDRSFVTEMEVDEKAAAIVASIVALGRALHLTVTAEGVETKAEARALGAAGCDQAQGYLFGRPLSLSSANALAGENVDTGSDHEDSCVAWSDDVPKGVLA